MPLRTGGALLVAATSLAAALLGGAALFQLKTADLASSERDHLLHLIARTQTEMAASELNDASARASRITRAVIEEAGREAPGSSPRALEHAARRWMRAEPSLREVSTLEHPAGDQRWQRDALLPGADDTTPSRGDGALTSPPEPFADTQPRPQPSPLRVTIEEKSLTMMRDGAERRPILRVRALVASTAAAPPIEPWSLHLQFDLSPTLRALTRGPGHRFGHLALLTAEEDFAWGPTQRYDDGGSGWVELSDAKILAACEAWRSNGAAPDRFTPFHHGAHVFAVRGRTIKAFSPTPATICVVLPREGYSGLF